MTNRLWFQTGVGLVLAFLIIFLAIEVKVIFEPFFTIIRVVIIPLLLGGVLFYLTYPVQRLLEQHLRFPRWASILSIFVLMAGVIYILIAVIGPTVSNQIATFTESLPSIINQVQGYIDYLLRQRDRLPEQAEQYVNDFINNIDGWISGAGSGFWNFLVTLMQGVLYVVLAPFFLVYMLKDHERFVPFVASFFSGERRIWIRKTLHDIDNTLKSFIQGQLLVSFLVGVMLLIGYWIIGLDYALLMAFLGMIFNVIPFLGPFISVAPAMAVALIQDPIMALYVAIVMLVAQQIEGNLITPNVMGNVLHVNPITVIAIVLAAGSLFGFLGIIIAVPTYAVVKDVVKNIYDRRQEITETAAQDVDHDD